MDNTRCTNIDNLVPEIDNVFAIMGVVATDYGWGNTSCSATSLFVKKILDAGNTSYSSFQTGFNALSNNLKKKTFATIKEFYEKNYYDMLDCLDGSDMEMWEDTK